MIQTVKELERLLKLLRKQGVSEFRHGDLALKLGDIPQDTAEFHTESDIQPEDPYAGFPGGMLTPEQLAFYASGGRPEDDPFIQKATG